MPKLSQMPKGWQFAPHLRKSCPSSVLPNSCALHPLSFSERIGASQSVAGDISVESRHSAFVNFQSQSYRSSSGLHPEEGSTSDIGPEADWQLWSWEIKTSDIPVLRPYQPALLVGGSKIGANGSRSAGSYPKTAHRRQFVEPRSPKPEHYHHRPRLH